MSKLNNKERSTAEFEARPGARYDEMYKEGYLKNNFQLVKIALKNGAAAKVFDDEGNEIGVVPMDTIHDYKNFMQCFLNNTLQEVYQFDGNSENSDDSYDPDLDNEYYQEQYESNFGPEMEKPYDREAEGDCAKWW